MSKKHQSTHAACATAIKAELLTAYPKVKFSVRSSSFSMGDSVHVEWDNGPTVREVTEITDQYQEGHFDSMTDMYEYSNTRKDIPQTKYVQGRRSMSQDAREVLMPFAIDIFDNHDYGCLDASNLLHRIFCKTSLPGSAKITGIEENTECTSGDVYDFFKIVYEVPEVTAPVETKGLTIVDYSEKAIAVIGEAEILKSISDRMYSIGGKYNKHLKCGAGYIFSKRREEQVRAELCL